VRRASPSESEYKHRQIIDTVPSLLWSRGPTANRPTSISEFWTIPARGKRIFGIVVGRHSCTPTTFRKLHRLSIGQFRPERPTRLCTVCVGRTASIVGTILVLSLCAINRDGSSVYGVSVDIDERKKAEERLRRSETYLAEAQRLSHCGVTAYKARRFSMGRKRFPHLGV